MVPMFESDLEDNTFRRRLMKEVAPGVPVHFSFYSPSVKVQIQPFAEFLQNEGSDRRFLYAANRNDRFRGRPVITELDLDRDLEEQVFDHAMRARSLGNPDPLGLEEPPGHTTVRNANLVHPLPMTPSLMSRGVFYEEQIEAFADVLRRVLVDGERLAGVDELRIQRGKLFHTTKMPGVGMRTRARVLASGLLDDEYTYENLLAIQGVTEAQARTIAEAARVEAARIEAGGRAEVRGPLHLPGS